MAPVTQITVLFLLLASTASFAAPAKDLRRPNIVLLVADDLGWADIGSFGSKDIATPHLDRIAREGVRFPEFYANGPSCTPTRAALLTGRYQQRIGGLEAPIGIGGVGRYDDAIRLDAQHELGLPVKETSIAHMLKGVGYATALIGKWHLGYEDKFSPNRHGFEHAFYCGGGAMDYFHHVEPPPSGWHDLRLNGEAVRRAGYFTDLIAHDAVEWLRQHRAREGGKPFFLFVPFTAPHSPFQGPDEDSPEPLPPDSPRWHQGQSVPHVYAAMIERMDHAIGRILAVVEEQGLARETLILFVSDNGGTRASRPSGLRGYKSMAFEGGIRVPALARWPGVLPAGIDYNHPGLTFDLTVSIASAAGAALPETRSFDGIDILRHVARGEPPPPRTLFWRARGMNYTWWAVREGALKYVAHRQGERFEEWLFDVAGDIGEQRSLLAERPDDAMRFKGKLAAWELEVRASRP